MANAVGVPTARGIGGAFADAAWGGVAGLTFGLTSALFGSGILGLLGATVVSGAVLRGQRGTAVASVLGFLLAASLFAGGGAAGGQTADAGVM